MQSFASMVDQNPYDANDHYRKELPLKWRGMEAWSSLTTIESCLPTVFLLYPDIYWRFFKYHPYQILCSSLNPNLSIEIKAGYLIIISFVEMF